MTQPLLFADLEFNATNLLAWAERIVAAHPNITGKDVVTDGETNSPAYVLRSVLNTHYWQNLEGLSTFDLKEELVGYLMDGISGKLPCHMNADELAATIVEEMNGYDFATMEEFLDSGLASNWEDDA